MHVGGHDFILIDHPPVKKYSVETISAITNRLCRRQTGIGALGAIFLYETDSSAHAFQVYSCSGNPAESISDAVLCVCRYLFDSGKLNQQNTNILDGFRNLKIPIRVVDSRHFSFSIGVPREIGGGELVEKSGKEYGKTVTFYNRYFTFTPLFLKYPGIVHFVGDMTVRELKQIHHRLLHTRLLGTPAQPVFVQTYSRDEIFMRTWYRNSLQPDFTVSAAHSLIGAVVNGFADRQSLVHCPDGQIYIQWDKITGDVFVSGTAEYTFSGSIYLENIRMIQE